MSDFTALVATGKWDRWAKVAADRGKYAADKAVAFHTECQKFNATSRRTAFGAAAVQGGSGGVENVITLPADFTPDGEAYSRVLSTLTYFRTNGTKYPPFAALVVPAKHKVGAQVAFVGVHMPTRNTARRRDVWASCAGGLIALVAGLRKTGVHVVVGVDTNARWKNTADQKLLEQIATATGCHWAYETHVPSTRRSLIDNLLTDLPIRSVELIDPVASSDHPWTRIGLSIPAPVTPTPAPVTPVEKPMSSGYQTDLVDALRGSGLKVVETPGWKTRGHGGFSAVETIVCHHTAGPSSGNMPSLGVVTNGRAGLAGPLCNFGLGRDGTVYVVAAGVAWHAGVVSSNAYSNTHALGIEAEATGTSSWPAAQMDAYARLCRALCDYYDIPVSRVLGHKEVASPRGRKVDPNFEMGAFRGRVQAVSPARVTDPNPIPAKEAGMNNVQYGRKLIAAGLTELGKAKGRRVVAIQAAVIRTALAAMPKA